MDTLRYKVQNTQEILSSRLSYSSAESEILQKFGYLRVPLEVMKGKASVKQTRNYLIFIVAIFIAVCVYAQIVFPESYSIFRNTISDQGGIITNPDGHQIWNLGLIVLGIFSIPHFLYLYQILKSLSIVYSIVSTILGIICSLSMTLVGIFPLDFKVPHGVFAGICFIGIFLKANTDLILNIIKRNKNREQKNDLKVSNSIMIVIFYVIFNVSFLMMMFTFIISRELVPFWEWVYFTSILVWILGTYIVK